MALLLRAREGVERRGCASSEKMYSTIEKNHQRKVDEQSLSNLSHVLRRGRRFNEVCRSLRGQEMIYTASKCQLFCSFLDTSMLSHTRADFDLQLR